MNITGGLGIVILATALGSPFAASADQTQRAAAGARIAQEVSKGNCLACHSIPGDARAVTSANIGPPLVAIRARFADREQLRRQIWDATLTNPDTVMPPFGKHKILTAGEIELVIDYLFTL